MSFIKQLIEADHNLFYFLNSKHVSWLDQPMFLFSTDWFWIPLYAICIYLLIKRYQKRAWLPIAFIFIGVLFTDQISGVIKKSVQRPRPTHHILFEQKVHIINDYRGGNYGFVSSHAANTFCIAIMLISFLYFRTYSSSMMIFWATLVSYSRIYLGVHFPADVLGGAVLGFIIAVFLIIIKKRVELRLFSNV